MKHLIFSIHDTKAEAYLPPFILHATGMATRAFEQCINAPDHQFHRSPSDYTLFNLGEFDDNNATIKCFNAPKFLGNGVEFLQQKQQTIEKHHSGQIPDESKISDDAPVLSGAIRGNSA